MTRYNVGAMKRTTLFFLALLLVFALSIMVMAKSAAKTTVELKDAQGKSVGTAVLSSKTGKNSGVSMKAQPP